MTLTVSAIKAERQNGKFDIFEAIETTLQNNKIELQNEDVLVISSKYVSNSQGRLIDLEKVNYSKDGIELSEKFQIKPKIAEVILRESDVIFGGISGMFGTFLSVLIRIELSIPGDGIFKDDYQMFNVLPTNAASKSGQLFSLYKNDEKHKKNKNNWWTNFKKLTI